MSKIKKPITTNVSNATRKKIAREALGQLSPLALTAIVCFLQLADNYRNGTLENERAMTQVDWFREQLVCLLGGDHEFNRLVDRIGL
mgnify:CR=1 FL=1